MVATIFVILIVAFVVMGLLTCLITAYNNDQQQDWNQYIRDRRRWVVGNVYPGPSYADSDPARRQMIDDYVLDDYTTMQLGR